MYKMIYVPLACQQKDIYLHFICLHCFAYFLLSLKFTIHCSTWKKSFYGHIILFHNSHKLFRTYIIAAESVYWLCFVTADFNSQTTSRGLNSSQSLYIHLWILPYFQFRKSTKSFFRLLLRFLFIYALNIKMIMLHGLQSIRSW